MAMIKKIIKISWLGLSIAALLFCLPACVGAGSKSNEAGGKNAQSSGLLTKGFFPLGQQIEWIYTVDKGDATVEETAKITRAEPQDDGAIYWSRVQGGNQTNGYLSDRGLEIRGENDTSYNPALLVLEAEVQLGATYTTESNLETEDSSTPIIVKSQVLGMEDITTTQLEIKDCVHYQLYLITDGDANAQGTLWREAWLCKGLGIVKSNIYDQSGNLMTAATINQVMINGKAWF